MARPDDRGSGRPSEEEAPYVADNRKPLNDGLLCHWAGRPPIQMPSFILKIKHEEQL